MKRSVRPALLLLTCTLVSACSTSTSAPGTAPSNTASGSAAPAGGGPAPSGANTASVKSTHSGYPPGLDFSRISSAVAEYGLAGNKKSLFIYLSNTDLTSIDPSKNKLAEGQGIVKLLLIRTEKDVDPGTYVPASGTADLKVEPSIVVANGTTLQFSSFDTKGSVTLTSITADKVTGTFDLKDNNHTISGSFDAPFRK